MISTLHLTDISVPRTYTLVEFQTNEQQFVPKLCLQLFDLLNGILHAVCELVLAVRMTVVTMLSPCVVGTADGSLHATQRPTEQHVQCLHKTNSGYNL